MDTREDYVCRLEEERNRLEEKFKWLDLEIKTLCKQVGGEN